jgi:hypothetical protein
MHPSPLRLGPSQSRPLTDASPGSARSPGLRVCRAANSRRRNIHTHAPFRTECQSFLRCRDMMLTISRRQRSGHAAALRRQRPQVRILSGAPKFHRSETKLGTQRPILPSCSIGLMVACWSPGYLFSFARRRKAGRDSQPDPVGGSDAGTPWLLGQEVSEALSRPIRRNPGMGHAVGRTATYFTRRTEGLVSPDSGHSCRLWLFSKSVEAPTSARRDNSLSNFLIRSTSAPVCSPAWVAHFPALVSATKLPSGDCSR